MVQVAAIRHWSASDFRRAVDGFAAEYVVDWNVWLSTPASRRAFEFGRILRRWQATRPRTMRRSREEAAHGAPFLDDLLAMASLRHIASLETSSMRTRTQEENRALHRVWSTFEGLPVDGRATCVGITKATMLATDGRIGPALDSNLQNAIGARPVNATEWVEALEGIADDIAAFRARNGPLADCVSDRFKSIAEARLYDMALGPRAIRDGPAPNGGRTASRSAPARDGVAYSLGWYESRRFEGFVPVSELRGNLGHVPNAPGVYVVLRLATTTPTFRARSAGGWFKGKDPTVDPKILEARWRSETPTLYVGKADSLRPRVNALLRFGAGEPVGHWGGRYLWQVVDCESFLVGWRPEQEARAVESRLLSGFVDRFGTLPFANINA